MDIDNNSKLNPTLRDELGFLRGGMIRAAERTPMPNRFSAEAHDSRPAVVVTDAHTGRKTTVALCNYQGVRQALNELLG